MDVLADAGDSEYAGELHNPPDENLHAEQRITRPGKADRGDKHGKRDVGVEHVRPRHVAAQTADDTPLPQRTGKQHRRENEVYQFVGNQDNAERNDGEADDDERGIDAEGTANLTTIHTQ